MDGQRISTMSLPAVLARVRNPLWSAAALYIVVQGLKEAQSVLLPILVSAMLAVICAPAVKWLRKRRVPNSLAVLVVVSGMMGLIFLVGALVGNSVADFREAVPRYITKLQTMMDHVVTALQARGLQFDPNQLLHVVEPASAAKKALGFVGTGFNAIAAALSNSFLVILTLIMMLLEGGTIPAKLRALAGPDADITPYQRIASEMQSYLAIKTVLSLITGGLVFLIARMLGVDFALLWGLIAFLLNYIPNIGSIVAAIPACLLCLIQLGPGPTLILATSYVVINTVIGNVLEPMWMGQSLGLSTTVVFLSLVLWGWIWGPVGMLLSVPLTMMIKIMLENSRELSYVATLLDVGEDEPPSTVFGRRSSTPGASSVVEAISSVLHYKPQDGSEPAESDEMVEPSPSTSRSIDTRPSDNPTLTSIPVEGATAASESSPSSEGESSTST
ncbi:MAG: AI-2E family transporter [Myxococcota bacterium]